MASSKTEICNRALRLLGVRRMITDVESDQTLEAEVCNDFYVHALRNALAAADWWFARVYEELVRDAVDPPAPWQYQYLLPETVIRPRWIEAGLYLSKRSDQRVAYALGLRVVPSEQLVLRTDKEPPCVLVYTRFIENPNLYPSYFEDYLSWVLALSVAPGITGDDKKLQLAAQGAQLALPIARAKSFGSEQEPPPPESEFIAARET